MKEWYNSLILVSGIIVIRKWKGWRETRMEWHRWNRFICKGEVWWNIKIKKSETANMKVGIAGLGRMGSGMANTLLRNNVDVFGYDINRNGTWISKRSRRVKPAPYWAEQSDDETCEKTWASVARTWQKYQNYTGIWMIQIIIFDNTIYRNYCYVCFILQVFLYYFWYIIIFSHIILKGFTPQIFI